MVNNHVLFHIIPRYSSSKSFGGVVFEDKHWPTPSNIIYNNSNEQTLIKLHSYIKLKLNEINN